MAANESKGKRTTNVDAAIKHIQFFFFFFFFVTEYILVDISMATID